MKNTSFTITVLFSPLSAFNVESNTYIICFNVHHTYQRQMLNFPFLGNIKSEKYFHEK